MIASQCITAVIAAALVTMPLSHRRVSAQTIDTMALRTHTRVLSADSLRGRSAGTPGERIAARYIARTLADLGLEPANGDFLHPVPLKRIRIDPATRLLVASDTDTTEFRHGRDFVFGAGGDGAFRDFAGVIVHAGAIADTAALVGKALGGRVVVAPGTPGAESAGTVARWADAGVAAVILGVSDADAFQAQARPRGDTRYFLDAPVDDPVWQPRIPVLIASPSLLAALVAHTHVRLHLVAETEALPAANVAAVLPGSDPRLRDEYVAYTAHYDHLGVGEPDATGDSIYNGFFDNAAGVAMLLAIAQAMRDSPPPRSVLFLFFTAEERGLLGSTWYASHPPRPLDSTVAVINLDAGAPAAPPVSWRIDGDSTTVGAFARAIALRHGWMLRFFPARPISDHWPFAKRGVPAIFLVPGSDWEGMDARRVAALKQRWDHYHHPADEWAPDFPFAGLARYAAFALDIGRAAARAPDRNASKPERRH